MFFFSLFYQIKHEKKNPLLNFHKYKLTGNFLKNKREKYNIIISKRNTIILIFLIKKLCFFNYIFIHNTLSVILTYNNILILHIFLSLNYPFIQIYQIKIFLFLFSLFSLFISLNFYFFLFLLIPSKVLMISVIWWQMEDYSLS